jgi:ATP-dependent DNA helicase RecG
MHMDLSGLGALVAAGESVGLELKKSTAEKDRACRTLCALANGQGGVVVFGVTPAGKVVGQRVTDRTLEELAQEFQGFEPPLFPQLQRVVVSGDLEAIVLVVGRTTHAPVSFRGVPYERVLNTTRVMSRAAYQNLLMESLHATDRWETQAAKGWTVDRLDTREMVLTLEEAIRRGRSEDPGTRDPQEILRGLGLLVGEQVSRAAVALFCKGDAPQPDFMQLTLRLARFEGVERDAFLDNRQFHGNAFELMRRAERFLIDWLPVASRIVPGQLARLDTPSLPVEAVREALANAFVHRDYASGGGAVALALFDDRLEIISAGGLHFGLTPEMLFLPHESRPWNPLIANVFYRRGHIESWGRGTLKIMRLMEDAGFERPTLKEQAGFVTLTFVLPGSVAPRLQGPGAAGTAGEMSEKNPGKMSEKKLAKTSEKTSGKKAAQTSMKKLVKTVEKTSGKMSEKTPGKMSEKKLAKTSEKTPESMLRLIVQNPFVATAELSLVLGVTTRTVARNLRKLQLDQRLVRVGGAKGGYWQVLQALPVQAV